MIVWIYPDGHNILGTIFVDPDFQDRGVGSAAWKFIEAKYPQSNSWRLGTPKFATKNHHFYESKCGFHRVESKKTPGESDDFIDFRKEMNPERK